MRLGLYLLPLALPLAFVGCGGPGEEGDACEADEDCADELHCDLEADEPVCIAGEHDHEHTM